MKRRAGFTLIELLVVIAIIAILAAILFPVFAQARERARTVSCLSNVGQITRAVRMYADDNNGVWPYCCDAEDRVNHASQAASMPLFWDVMAKYVKSQDAWRCPSDKGYKRSNGTVVKNAYKQNGSSYSTNWELCWDRLESKMNPVKLDQAPQPTKAMVVFDYWGMESRGESSQQSQWHIRKWPEGCWNVGFFDGHAKNLSYNDINYPDGDKTNPWLFSPYWYRPGFPKVN